MTTQPVFRINVQSTEYGFKVQLPSLTPHTERHAYRLNRDPPRVMRLIEFNPDRSVTIDKVVRSYVEGSSNIYTERVYEKIGAYWVTTPSNHPDMTKPQPKPKDYTSQALDALLNESRDQALSEALDALRRVTLQQPTKTHIAKKRKK